MFIVVSIRPQRARATPASLREAGRGSTGFFNTLLEQIIIPKDHPGLG
jgi:hypothetical protein